MGSTIVAGCLSTGPLSSCSGPVAASWPRPPNGCRNPAAGCLLARWFAAADLTIEHVQAHPILSRSLATSERLCRLHEALGQLESATAHQWREQRCREEAEGSFLCALIGFIVLGTRRR